MLKVTSKSLVDSARIQTVTQQASPLYYELLTAFKQKTGIGLLLNTSLNRRGTPIVETPDDAMMLFLYSAIDLLVIGDFLVRGSPISEHAYAADQLPPKRHRLIPQPSATALSQTPAGSSRLSRLQAVFAQSE